MHDGQNLFLPSTSYDGEWKVDKVLEKLVAEGKVEEMIVVGIYHAGSQRSYDYVPFPKGVPELGSIHEKNNPGFKEFANFVAHQVVPYIDRSYRTIPDRTNRAIMGSSHGGISAFWIGNIHSDLFSTIGSLSPSFWVGNGQIFQEAANRAKEDIKIWYDIGTLEWRDYTGLIDILVAKGFSYGSDLFYYEDKGARHHETAWTERIRYPLILFKGKPPWNVVDFYVEVEVLKDGGGGAITTKLNPVVEMDNGIKYSLYRTVDYEMLTKAFGNIDERGWFEFTSNKNLSILIKYKTIEKVVVIDYSKIQHEIKTLTRNSLPDCKSSP